VVVVTWPWARSRSVWCVGFRNAALSGCAVARIGGRREISSPLDNEAGAISIGWFLFRSV
jgi:hypothetical protein